MTDRIVEIATPARLSVRNAQLVIGREDMPEVTTPVCEIAVLMIAHRHVTLTHAVLSQIGAAGGIVITCDEKFTPVSMMLPVQGHFLQTEILAKQAALSAPGRKRLWFKIVRAKIRAQAHLLRELHGVDGGLQEMAARVRSGDVGNLEAQAARRYWPLLFNDSHFRRGGEEHDQNRYLDYGYTVLRAATARALCAVGLHPSIGIRHHNRYDVFSLASDVMEPFRVVVDRKVFQWVQEHDPAAPLESGAKQRILEMLTDRYDLAGERRTLFDVVARTAQGLARSICGDAEAFSPPEKLPLCFD